MSILVLLVSTEILKWIQSSINVSLQNYNIEHTEPSVGRALLYISKPRKDSNNNIYKNKELIYICRNYIYNIKRI